MSTYKIKPLTVMCIAALAGMSIGNALAQEQPATNNEGQENANLDNLVVTGSRIKRSNATTAIPVQILNQEDIAEIGSVDVGEILTEIPGVDYSLSPENTALSTQNSALSTVNLRRLGGNRTLTLIDGRRAVSNSGNGERVSLQTIPAGFVSSVEVTTGGASAIYGSDAIAGVANIILRDDFEGFEINARRSDAQASGEEENTVDITFGSAFANGRGHTMIGLSYDDETAIFADSTRPESIANVEWNRPNRSRLSGEEDNPAAFGSEIGFGDCDNSGRFCINPSGSSNLPGGLFEGDDAWNIGGVWFNDRSLLPNDGRLGSFAFETDVDGFNFRPGRTLSPSVETLALGWKTDFSINSQLDAFVDINYSEVESLSRNAALNVNSGTDIGFNNAFGDVGTISSSHPFIPAEVEETRSGSVSWRRRFVEVGTRDRDNNRKTLRTAFGVEGIARNNWEWTVFGTYGNFDQDQRYINELDYMNIRHALDIEADGNGGFQCVDANARAAGCVPLNIFGEGAISQAAADYVRYNGVLFQERDQKTLNGSVTGELLQMPSGPLQSAFGFEYRKEEQETIGDPDNEFELTSVTPIPDIVADFDVTEVFAEFDIPLSSNAYLQLAARAADYSTVGSVLSYNVGGSWQPNPSVRFRAQYSRSQRAPTLTEFFSPPRGDFDSLRDPCDGLNPDGSGITPAPGSTADPAVISANCLSQPAIQAFFANPDNAGLAFEFDGSVSGPNAGNDQLFEETADTYTIGAVITPTAVPDLVFIIDYYNITVEDAIGSISTQLTADLCYSSADFPNNRFCNVISRDLSTGFVNQVINRQENLNELVVEGIDVTVDYEWEFSKLPGRFAFNVIYNRALADDFEFLGINGPETLDFIGEISSPEDEFRSRLRWTHNGWSASWTARHRGGGVDDLRVASSDNEFFSVGSQTYHNLYLRYEFRNEPNMRVYAGINNIFDDLGPMIPTGLDHGNTRNIVSRLNDVEGREFYAGLRLRW